MYNAWDKEPLWYAVCCVLFKNIYNLGQFVVRLSQIISIHGIKNVLLTYFD
jgi:hypothetical protein